jgi:hypothetical protein
MIEAWGKASLFDFDADLRCGVCERFCKREGKALRCQNARCGAVGEIDEKPSQDEPGRMITSVWWKKRAA